MPVPSQRLVTAYLTGSLRRVLAGWSMDQFARLSILEGAAGVSPGTWLRQRERGFGHALEYFGPKLAASWTATSDQGVFDRAISAASYILRNAVGTDAEDLIQDALVGSTSSSGPARSRLFYSVGATLLKNRVDLTLGDVTPRDRRVLGMISNWVARFGHDVLKSKAESLRVSPKSEPQNNEAAPKLTNDERTNLMLLALQSPGGPGKQVRQIIDQLIDRAFTPAEAPIIRNFLQKIVHPRYRSVSEMKILQKNFDPTKWFTKAYNLVRKELMAELGVSAQQLTNALGNKAKNVFTFMRNVVGRDSRIKRIVEELSEEIELLEPGVSRLGKESPAASTRLPVDPYNVVRRWLERSKKERDANLSSSSALASLEDSFEKDDMYEWSEMATPFAQYSRGPAVLRVAAAWVKSRG